MSRSSKTVKAEIERRRAAAERLRGLFADVAPVRSMSGELITQRRAEARAEDREGEAWRCRRSGR
jgi:hypothetical protein